MKRKLTMILMIIILLLQSIFISGCWSTKEPEDVAMVTIFGWDLATENGLNKYKISARIMRPPGKGGSDQPGQGGPTEALISGAGGSLGGAVSELIERLPRTPFYENISASVLGENVAKEKTGSFMELSLRYPESRPNMSLFVTKGEAFRVLQVQPATVPTLSGQIKKQVQVTVLRTSVACEVTLPQFAEMLLSPDRDAILPEIEPVSPEKGETIPKSVIIQGFGVFRQAKLVGWLNKEEAQGYLFVSRKIRNSLVPIEFSKGEKLLVYTLTGSKSKIEPKMIDGKPSFKVTIQTQGQIMENHLFNITPQEVKPLEEQIGEKIRELVLATIAKAKEYDSDFLGLMQKLHRYDPSAWQDIAPNWRESFREADVEVEVKAKIVGVGLSTKALPLEP